MHPVLVEGLKKWQAGALERAWKKYLAADHQPGDLKPKGYFRYVSARSMEYTPEAAETDDKRAVQHIHGSIKVRGTSESQRRKIQRGYVGCHVSRPLAYWIRLRQAWSFLDNVKVDSTHRDAKPPRMRNCPPAPHQKAA